MTVPDAPKRRRHGAGSTEALLTALIAGHSVQASATIATMSEASARRRLAEPHIRTKLDELRSTTLGAAADRLTSLALGASVVLAQIMNDTTQPASVRVRAAAVILARAVPVREASWVEDRLAHIESALSRRDSWSQRAS